MQEYAGHTLVTALISSVLEVVLPTESLKSQAFSRKNSWQRKSPKHPSFISDLEGFIDKLYNRP